MNSLSRTIAASTAAVAIITLASCSSDADVVDKNIKKAAEQFEIQRRIVAIDTISDKYIIQVEGFCSLEWPDGARSDIICKLKDGSYVKNTVHLSDNVTVVSEQMNGTNVSATQYRVIFKPESIVPNVDRP